MLELPIGCIFCYPSPVCPEGFLPCDGRELSKNGYKELYELIGGTWGETEETFFIPDLQGKFVRGWDKDGDVDSSREFGTFQDDAFQGHSHKIQYSKSVITEPAGKHYHDLIANAGTAVTSVGGMGTVKSTEYFHEWGYPTQHRCSNNIECAADHFHKLDMPEIKVVDPQTSVFQPIRVATETRPKNVALMFCIKVR